MPDDPIALAAAQQGIIERLPPERLPGPDVESIRRARHSLHLTTVTSSGRQALPRNVYEQMAERYARTGYLLEHTRGRRLTTTCGSGGNGDAA